MQIQTDWFRAAASPQARLAQFGSMPAMTLVSLFAPRLQAERTMGVDQTMAFYVSDTGEHVGIEIRRGVAQILNQAPDSPQFTVGMAKAALARLVAGDATLAQLIETKAATVTGDARGATTFMDYFDPPLRDWSDLHFTTQ